ncbi:MAG: YHS domain-containing protein [Armatimonadetes bacterium]|nr:YHS domain-containing protein [Armatimonadota bacterium]
MKDAVKSPDGKKFQDYHGKRYYFCCDGCPESFAKEPDKYAEKNDEKVKPTDG